MFVYLRIKCLICITTNRFVSSNAFQFNLKSNLLLNIRFVQQTYYSESNPDAA